MTWLITGGCGFIGTNLANMLLKMGQTVVIVDNLSRVGSVANLKWLRSRYGDGWRFEQADIRDAASIERLVSDVKPCSLAHLAGQVAMTTSISNPRLDFEVNALGTLNVLEAVRLFSPYSAVLYSSTNKVYGSLEQLQRMETEYRYILPDYPNGLDETLPLDGCSPYGCSKLAADQYIHDFHRVYDIPTVVFRHSSMYGGRQFATYDQGWVGWFCQKALEASLPNASSLTISGDGKQVRDVLHVDDLVDLYLAAGNQIGTAAGHVFNVGGGMENSLSLRELFTRLEELTGNRLSYECSAWRHGDQRVFVADTRKATSFLGWQPRVDKVSGLKRMLAWTRQMDPSTAGSAGGA